MYNGGCFHTFFEKKTWTRLQDCVLLDIKPFEELIKYLPHGKDFNGHRNVKLMTLKCFESFVYIELEWFYFEKRFSFREAEKRKSECNWHTLAYIRIRPCICIYETITPSLFHTFYVGCHRLENGKDIVATCAYNLIWKWDHWILIDVFGVSMTLYYRVEMNRRRIYVN